MDAPTREHRLSDTLAPALAPEEQFFIRRLAVDYDLEARQLRRLAEIARDLEMWREPPLSAWWEETEARLAGTPGDPAQRRETLLRRLDAHIDRLQSSEKTYPFEPLRGLTRTKPVLVERPSPTPVFGLCPFFSKDANCCGLHTIDAVSGCALGCSYCPVHAFLAEKVEFSTDLAERLAEARLDRARFYHVSTGQFSDSLVWGNRHGILDALLDFADRHPNVLLELKTKSDRIESLLDRDLPANVLCSWILNTDTMIRNEEHGTATLGRRLHVARVMADRDCRVGFHIHPVTYYGGWGAEYTSLAGRLMSTFSPDELTFLSMAVPSFTPPVVREIRRRGGESKALQMPLTADPQGKLTYPAERRIELYSTLYRAFQPWHGRLFFYLCMETSPVWEAVLGRTVTVSQELQRVFTRQRQAPRRSTPASLAGRV
jgi:spore photoproduct lyase